MMAVCIPSFLLDYSYWVAYTVAAPLAWVTYENIQIKAGNKCERFHFNLQFVRVNFTVLQLFEGHLCVVRVCSLVRMNTTELRPITICFVLCCCCYVYKCYSMFSSYWQWIGVTCLCVYTELNWAVRYSFRLYIVNV